MYFENLAALISMNGHGAYVWSAYFLALLLLGYLLLNPVIKHRKLVKDQRRIVFLEAKRQREK